MSNEYKVKILMTEFVTHDVKRFIVEKPEGYSFEAGQACEVSIDVPGFREKKRPFTFTSLNSDEVLEFTIKKYPSHNSITKKIHEMNTGDSLIIGEPFGTINFKGKGVFIAGGAGITPFIAIIRKLVESKDITDNSLIFSNKKAKDIILEKEFENSFGEGNFVFTLSDEKKLNYSSGRIDKNFLENWIENFNQYFYVCGPPEMVEEIRGILKELGVEDSKMVFEGMEND